MSDLDHGEFPIAVRMTSQLFHTLLVSSPDHIQLLPPTSSNHDVHEYDGIHTPPNMSHDIVVNTNGHNDASPPNGKFTSPYRTLVSSSNSRSQCTCPHSSTSDSRSQCLHAHSPTYNSSSKRRSVTPLQHGVPLMCHVMVPCSDPEVTYRRDDGPHTEHFRIIEASSLRYEWSQVAARSGWKLKSPSSLSSQPYQSSQRINKG